MHIIYFWFLIFLTTEESSYRMKNAQLRLHLSTLLSLGKKPTKSPPQKKQTHKTFKHPKKGTPYSPVAQPADVLHQPCH